MWFGLGTSDFRCGKLVASLVLLVVVAVSRKHWLNQGRVLPSVFPSSKVQSMNVLKVSGDAKVCASVLFVELAISEVW